MKVLDLVVKSSVVSVKELSMIIHDILKEGGDKMLKLHSAFYPLKSGNKNC